MDEIATSTTGQFGLSVNAASRIKAMLEAEPAGSFFRVAVNGGGCSGFQYEWNMTDNMEKGTLIEDILVLDKTAEMFVIGCTVDYVEEFGGSYLKVINPNATAQCGCGESFAI